MGLGMILQLSAGTDIFSTHLGSRSYMALSGTSMATPLVAGATALVWSWMGRSFVSDLDPRIAPEDLCAGAGCESRSPDA